MEKPIVGITMGDPAGVGPEILVKALAEGRLQAACRPLVVGDPAVLSAAAGRIGLDFAHYRVTHPREARFSPGVTDVAAVSDLSGLVAPGHPTPETGRAMVEYVLAAIAWALSGDLHAVATCPIHKAAMHAAGYTWSGHTEILAEKTGTARYRMMLAGDRLRVVLVTIHVALSEVPGLVTRHRVAETIRVTAEALASRFGIPRPRIAVAGLNPHAGEGGLFGDEEIRVIAPAVEQVRAEGVNTIGPLPPDTLFIPARLAAFDAVVCMYHDQGLIPFKMLHFDDGVNTTLGLPIIRTSVDHGTAYDLAGTGRASHQSLVAAVEMAARQATLDLKKPGT